LNPLVNINTTSHFLLEAEGPPPNTFNGLVWAFEICPHLFLRHETYLSSGGFAPLTPQSLSPPRVPGILKAVEVWGLEG
jgi:hypothetical protein